MTKEFTRLGGQFTFSKVGKQRKRTYTEKHTKHKNIQQGLVTIYCYNVIFAYMKVKNRSAMRTWGLMLKFIPFGWNAILTYQCLEAELLQAKR